MGHLCSLGYTQRAYQRGPPLHLVLVHRFGNLFEDDVPGTFVLSAEQFVPSGRDPFEEVQSIVN